jgi:hypothetical protein
MDSSDSLPPLLRIPFEKRLMHYDPPPPLTITDLEPMGRRGEFRFANRLSVCIEVEDGNVTGSGYSGGTIMGVTPFTVGPPRVMSPTKRNPEIQQVPQVIGNEATFVQTAGNRPGFSLLRPSVHWPFILTRPFTIWTTVELTVRRMGAAGSA